MLIKTTNMMKKHVSRPRLLSVFTTEVVNFWTKVFASNYSCRLSLISDSSRLLPWVTVKSKREELWKTRTVSEGTSALKTRYLEINDKGNSVRLRNKIVSFCHWLFDKPGTF